MPWQNAALRCSTNTRSKSVGVMGASGASLEHLHHQRFADGQADRPRYQFDSGCLRWKAVAHHRDCLASGNANGAGCGEILAMSTATQALVDLETIRAAASADCRDRREDAAGACAVRGRAAAQRLAQGREPAAHRQLQDSRRGEQDSSAFGGRDRARSHHLFERQSCAGRGVCRARGRR